MLVLNHLSPFDLTHTVQALGMSCILATLRPRLDDYQHQAPSRPKRQMLTDVDKSSDRTAASGLGEEGWN